MATPENDTPQNAENATLTVTSDGMKAASGSQSAHFQRELLEQVTASLWLPEWQTSERKLQAAKAAYDALQGIAPRSELEGMLAAQMPSTHNAAMDCLARAMMES